MNSFYIITTNKSELLMYEGNDINVGLQKLIEYYTNNFENTAGYKIHLGEKIFVILPCDNINKIKKTLEKILY